jgi:hypothetical protein
LASEMGPDRRKATVVLGDEYDEKLREALMLVLEDFGVQEASSRWAVGGSQELEEMDVEIGNEIVSIESETYVGLSIRGNPDLVQRIADAVSERMKDG